MILMAIPIPRNMIGGGRVTRTFNMGGRQMRMGEMLTGEEVQAIRQMNLTSLIERGHLHVWPKNQEDRAGKPDEGSVRFIVPLGFGRYNVVEGRKLNDEWLDKEAACKLAGLPPPDNGNGKTDH